MKILDSAPIRRVLSTGIAAVLACSAAALAAPGAGVPGAQAIGFSLFYDQLAPYGDWMESGPYGYVWVPREALTFGWRPYTVGEWLWTDQGWLFDSPDPWGWAVYHYGLWGFDPEIGWYWVPGSLWAPAWVAWCWGGSAIGWAPLPPGFDFGPGGFADFAGLDIPEDDWCFVDADRFASPDVALAILPRERTRDLLRDPLQRSRMVLRGDLVENPGVDPAFVARMTGREPVLHRIESASAPGPLQIVGGRVQAFRRPVEPTAGAAPPRVAVPTEIGRAGQSTRTRQYPPDSRGAQEMSQRHERERRLMDESQRKEAKRLDSGERKGETGREERAQVGESQRAAELRKSHQEEADRMAERQREENENRARARLPAKK